MMADVTPAHPTTEGITESHARTPTHTVNNQLVRQDIVSALGAYALPTY